LIHCLNEFFVVVFMMFSKSRFFKTSFAFLPYSRH
jgi:hypothetical protein